MSDDNDRANARIRELTERKNALTARVAELEHELEGANAKLTSAEARASKYKTQHAEAQADWEKQRGEWEQRQTLILAGIKDPKQQRAALWAYGDLDEQGRPALADWLDPENGSAKDDPFFGPVYAQVLGGANGKTQEAKRAPSQAGRQPNPAPAADGSRESYLEARARLTETIAKHGLHSDEAKQQAAALQDHAYLN